LVGVLVGVAVGVFVGVGAAHCEMVCTAPLDAIRNAHLPFNESPDAARAIQLSPPLAGVEA
jgi:hypothetical protein